MVCLRLFHRPAHQLLRYPCRLGAGHLRRGHRHRGRHLGGHHRRHRQRQHPPAGDRQPDRRLLRVRHARAARRGAHPSHPHFGLRHPNFTTLGITESDIAARTWRDKITGPLPMPYLITPQFAADVYERYGPDSAMYVSRVLGRFPESSADTLIPLSWVLAAVERWRERTELMKQGIATVQGSDKVLGVDIARFGTDRTCRTYREGAYVHWQRVTQQESLMQTAGRVAADLADLPGAKANLDVIGLGGGVVDRLVELHLPATGVNVAEKAADPERFANVRAEAYWHLRTLFETGQIMIPEDDELINELTQLKYKIVNSNGTIRLEEKEEMKKRLGKSPDLSDSLMLAYVEPKQWPEFSIDFF